MSNIKDKLEIHYVPLASLRHPELNPRVWTKEATAQLRESITSFGIIDPLIVNNAPKRKGIIVGGNFRATVMKEIGIEMVPVVYVNIPDKEKEAELIIRLNKNTGEFDLDLLAKFDQSFLEDIGFSSEEIDDIFPTETYGTCKLSSGQIIKLVKFNNKWYLDGDLPYPGFNFL